MHLIFEYQGQDDYYSQAYIINMYTKSFKHTIVMMKLSQ